MAAQVGSDSDARFGHGGARGHTKVRNLGPVVPIADA